MGLFDYETGDIFDIFPDRFSTKEGADGEMILLYTPWDLDTLQVTSEFTPLWDRITLGHDMPMNLLTAGRQLCDVLEIWKSLAVPNRRASREGAYIPRKELEDNSYHVFDSEIIELALRRPNRFDKMEAYCIEEGIDHMLDAYFSGVPLADILA